MQFIFHDLNSPGKLEQFAKILTEHEQPETESVCSIEVHAEL